MGDYKIAHVMFRVADPQMSIDFYKDAFGFHVNRKVERPEENYDLIYLADPDETIEVELTYNYGHGPYGIGEGYGHMAIATDDLEESWHKHKELGYEVSELKGEDAHGRKAYYFIQDPDGYQIEVVRA